MEQYLIEIYDNDYETLYDEYITLENYKEAERYAQVIVNRHIRTEDYHISIRNIKDI